jgi:hypothetical protein
MKQPGKRLTKPGEVHWVFDLMSFEVFPVDKHGRCVGKHERVSTIQEAHDLTTAWNAKGASNDKAAGQ